MVDVNVGGVSFTQGSDSWSALAGVSQSSGGAAAGEIGSGGGDYKAITNEETARKILHMAGVIQHITNKANELRENTGSADFEVIVSKNPAYFRPRAYVAPSNSSGIRQELSQAVLLKAALGMAGK